jgi:C4-dicarboxylate transporter DctM subunit
MMMVRVAKLLDGCIYKLNVAIGYLFSAILVLLAIFVFLNVATRWMGLSVPWLFAMCIISLTSFTFLTAAYTLGEGRHVTVDVVTMHLPEKSRVSLEILGYVFCLMFSAILCWQGAKWLHYTYTMKIVAGATSLSTIDIPYWIIILPVPLGSLLLVFQCLRLMVKRTCFLLNQQIDLRLSLVPVVLVILLFLAGILIAVNVSPIGGLFLSLLVLFFGGTPVAFTLAIVGTAGIYFFAGGSSGLPQVPMTAFSSVESFPLTALPLFVLIGTIMTYGGLAKALFSFTELWFGRVRGSLLIVTIATGAVICAITGSSVAATAMLTLLCLRILIDRGYDRRLSCGTVGAASVGSLIPPSSALIVYGTVVEMSVGKLFMAALIPSLIVFAIFALYVIVLSYTNKEKFGRTAEAAPWGEKLSNLRPAAPILFLPILILGGIYAGLFTATEAAGISVIYGLIMCVFGLRTLKWKELSKACIEGCHVSSMTLLILVGGMIFATVVSQLKIATAVVSFAKAVGVSQGPVVLVIFVALLIGGMFMSSMAMMLITLPVFYPLAKSVGIDGYWLGVFYTICIEIGLLTPPVGVNLFVLQGASDVPFDDIVIGMVPFIGILILGVAIMYFFPQLCTWLPSRMAY